ncbi:hypothetical protein [Glycomyces tenuis]|uniref:hypothetical protein n=1 Tax=Glycomyces tenuis TaxID=58116 RepID=UPI000558130B|nr:hypothetical protein [Glycomyces tenuis]
MSGSAVIKLPVELRDRIAKLAEDRRLTIAGAVAHALDAAEEAEFRDKSRSAMGTRSAGAGLRRQSERFAPSLSDELEPEDWSDVL